MQKGREREENSSKSYQDLSSLATQPKTYILSSRQNDLNSMILALARGCPSSLESISDELGIPFSECLKGARELQSKGLLRELDGPGRPEDLCLFLATGREP
ncbi:MAG: hypothetical protein E3J35_03010 [Methanomassiliicoccales archaeon]|nr:MAG: hypothetical protein E3J35_03010 [Methanomassiliicoccales archaeon]